MTISGYNPDNPVFTPKYWERPAPREQGDSGADRIYHAVGCALSAWEEADQALAHLFLVLSEPSTAVTPGALLRTYGTIFGNAGRREAVTAVAEVALAQYWHVKPIKGSITNIKTAFENASSRRDDIAHGYALGSIKVDNREYGAFLVPPEYNAKFTYPFMQAGELGFLKARYRYTSEDIYGFARKFNELRNTIFDYTAAIAKKEDGNRPLVLELLKAHGTDGKKKLSDP